MRIAVICLCKAILHPLSSVLGSLDILALDHYGLSEIIGPGVAGECVHRCGLHIAEDHFIPEIIDPDTGARLPDGTIGELVLSSVTKEALPLLRYRTRDRTRLLREPCACGRATVRMEKVLGRTDDMIVVRGVNVFPSQIESVLLQVVEVAPHYQILVERGATALDELEVLVEATPEVFANAERLPLVERHLSVEVRNVLGSPAWYGWSLRSRSSAARARRCG